MQVAPKLPTGLRETSMEDVHGALIRVPLLVSPYQSKPVEHELVSFAMVEHLCYESDPTVTLYVKRKGAGRTRVTLHWHTENMTVMEVGRRPRA